MEVKKFDASFAYHYLVLTQHLYFLLLFFVPSFEKWPKSHLHASINHLHFNLLAKIMITIPPI